MDYKKSKAPVNTVTRNIMDLCDETGNLYESVAIIAKRANQISVQKPSLLATQEFVEGKVYWRDPVKEAQQQAMEV